MDYNITKSHVILKIFMAINVMLFIYNAYLQILTAFLKYLIIWEPICRDRMQ